MRWAVAGVLVLALAGSCGDDDEDACPTGDSPPGEVGDTAEVEVIATSAGWVDVFGQLWIPMGSDEPAEGRAVATLAAEDRLAITSEDGSTTTFGIAACG